MKIIKLAIVIIFCGVLTNYASGQEKPDITGVWTGQIYNDSTHKYLPFELAVSRKNGELSGYSYTIFMIDSLENIGVKEVSIKEKGGLIIVRDKKLIDDNYTERPAKGVYTTLELSLSQNDTADLLDGRWFTNKTKLYYPLSGTVALSRKRLIYETRIIKRLSYLGLANSLSFVRPAPRYDDVASNPIIKKKEEPVATIVEPEMVIEIPEKDSGKSIHNPKAKELAGIPEVAKNSGNKKTSIDLDKPSNASAGNSQSTKTPDIASSVISDNPRSVKSPKNTDSEKQQEGVVKIDQSPAQLAAIIRDSSARVETQVIPAENAKNDVAKTSSGLNPPNAGERPLLKPGTETPISPPQDLANRKIETIKSVKIQNDSIVLSLYDNGVVDGDTVSVLLNGKVIVSKIGLLATAYNHTVHLTPDMGDSVRIILYAENLGSIPPNTGLLVVRDGGTDHEIRFSGDMKNNSAIILLRNKRQ